MTRWIARIDWAAVLLSLRREGVSTQHAARVIGVPRSTVMGWLAGSEPSHYHGELLLEIWMETMQLPRESAPKNVGIPTCHFSDNSSISHMEG